MANKYDVRQQIENEKSNRQQQAISNTVSFINSGLSFAGNVYNYNEQKKAEEEAEAKKNEEIAKQQQDKLDQEQAYLDSCKIFEEMPQKLSDFSYEWIEEVDPATGERTKRKTGNRLSTSATLEQAINHYSDTFLEDNGYLEGKSDAYVEALKSYYRSGIDSNRLNWSQQLVTARESEIQTKVNNSVASIINTAGSTSSAESTKAVLNAQLSQGYSKHWTSDKTLPEDATAEEKAEYDMWEEFNNSRNVLYNKYLLCYSPEEAEAKTLEQIPNLLLNMDLNSAKAEVDSLVRTDPTFDINKYSAQKAYNLQVSDYSEFLGDYKFSETDVIKHASDISTYASYAVEMFANEISSALTPALEGLSKSYSEGSVTGGDYLTESQVKDTLKSVAESLGTTVEIMQNYMTSSSVKEYNAYLYTGAYNDSLANTYEIQQLMNGGTVDEKKLYAEENGIDFTSEQDLDVKLLQTASVGGYSYLYDNPLTEDVYYDVVTIGSLVSSGTTSSSSSATYASAIENEVGAKPLETIEKEGKVEYSAKNYDEEFSALEDNYKTLNFLSQIDEIRKYPKFASFLESIFSKNESELTEAEKSYFDKYAPMINTLTAYGITSIDQITDDTISLITEKLETENSVLASNLADFNKVLYESGNYPTMLSAKSADEIKAQARHNSSIPTTTTNEEGETSYDYAGTGYDTISMVADAQGYTKALETIEKENAIQEREAIISSGTTYLQTAQMGISVLENAKTRYSLFEDEDSAEFLTAMEASANTVLERLMETAEISNPYIYAVMKDVLGIEEGEEINWSQYDAEDLDTIIKQIENSMKNKAEVMATADSELAGYAGEGYTKTTANRFIENAKNSAFNTSFASNLRKQSNSIVGITGQYKENVSAVEAQEEMERAYGDARYYLKCSIYKYELYGEGAGEDETFKSYKEQLTALQGREVTSEEVYKWMKQTDNDLASDFSDTRYTDYVALENDAFEQYCANQIWTAELYNPEASTPQANCGVDASALEYLYSKYVGDDYKEKGFDILFAEVLEEMGRKGADFDTEFRETANAIYDNLVNDKLVRLKGRNTDIYTAAKDKVDAQIAKNKDTQIRTEKAEQESVANLINEIAVQANSIMLTNVSATEVYEILEGVYGIENKELINSAISIAQKEFMKDGIAQIKLSETDLGGLAEYSALETYINNNAMNTLCAGTKMTAKTSTAILSSLYQGLVQISKTNPNADYNTYVNYIDGFVNNAMLYEDKAFASLFTVKKDKTVTANSYKKGEGIGYLGFGLSWAKGDASAMPTSSLLQNTSAMDGFTGLMTMIITDPSLDDCTLKKAACAIGIQFKEGSGTIDLNDVVEMSYEELVTRLDDPTNDTLVDAFSDAVADMGYQAGKVAIEFIKYSSTNQFLATIGKTADGNYGETELIITSDGPIIKTATYRGTTVYAQPVFSNNSDEIDSWNFYSDKNCTNLMYNLEANVRAGLTSEQQEQMNVESTTAKVTSQETTAEGWRKAGRRIENIKKFFTGNWDDMTPIDEEEAEPQTVKNEYGGTLTSKVVGVLFSNGVGAYMRPISEETQKLREQYLKTTYSYENSAGEVKSATGAELYGLLMKGEVRIGSEATASNYNTPAMVQKGLEQTCNYGLKQKQGSKQPPTSSVLAFHVSDGTYRITEAEIVTTGTQTANGVLLSYNNTEYLLKDGEIIPKLSTTLSAEKQARYTELGYEASQKSNNEFTPEECANAIGLLLEGYDLAFTYEDENGNYYTYIPKAYELIAKKYFLTTK